MAYYSRTHAILGGLLLLLLLVAAIHFGGSPVFRVDFTSNLVLDVLIIVGLLLVCLALAIASLFPRLIWWDPELRKYLRSNRRAVVALYTRVGTYTPATVPVNATIEQGEKLLAEWKLNYENDVRKAIADKDVVIAERDTEITNLKAVIARQYAAVAATSGVTVTDVETMERQHDKLLLLANTLNTFKSVVPADQWEPAFDIIPDGRVPMLAKVRALLITAEADKAELRLQATFHKSLADNYQQLLKSAHVEIGEIAKARQKAIEENRDGITTIADKTNSTVEKVMSGLKIDGKAVNALAELKAQKLAPQATLENGTLGQRVENLETLLRKSIRLINHDFEETPKFLSDNLEEGAVKDGMRDFWDKEPKRKGRGGNQGQQNDGSPRQQRPRRDRQGQPPRQEGPQGQPPEQQPPQPNPPADQPQGPNQAPPTTTA